MNSWRLLLLFSCVSFLPIGCASPPDRFSEGVLVVEDYDGMPYRLNYNIGQRRWVDIGETGIVLLDRFSDDRAIAVRATPGPDNFRGMSGAKKGYVDRNGNVVIDFEYDLCRPFSNGRALVMTGRSLGIIDTAGNKLFWMDNIHMSRNDAGYFLVEQQPSKDVFMLDRNGVRLWGSPGTGRLRNLRWNESGYLEGYDMDIESRGIFDPATGEVLFNVKNALPACLEATGMDDDRHSLGDVSEGVAIVTVFDKQSDRAGRCAVDIETREVVIATEAEELFARSEGFFRYRSEDGYSYFDQHGNETGFGPYTDCGDFSQGLARVKIGDWWGYIDTRGELAITARFGYAEDFSRGYAKIFYAYDNTARYGYIDREGNFVVPAAFEEMPWF